MKKLSIVCVLCVSLLGGCATQGVHVNKGGAVMRKQEMQTFFISGIGQRQDRDAADVCGGADKVSKIETDLNFGQWLIGVVTFGIFTPRGMKVYCTE